MTSWKITIYMCVCVCVKSSVYALIKCITNKQTSMLLNIGLNNSGVVKAGCPLTFGPWWIFRKEKKINNILSIIFAKQKKKQNSDN